MKFQRSNFTGSPLFKCVQQADTSAARPGSERMHSFGVSTMRIERKSVCCSASDAFCELSHLCLSWRCEMRYNDVILLLRNAFDTREEAKFTFVDQIMRRLVRSKYKLTMLALRFTSMSIAGNAGFLMVLSKQSLILEDTKVESYWTVN